MNRFEGKVGLVTGAGQGLGKEVALGLAREGGKVVVVDINEPMAQQTVDLIKETGSDAVSVTGDISNPTIQEAAVKAAVDNFGGLDVAANIAAIEPKHVPIVDVTLEDWHKVMDVNLTSTFLALKYQIPAMIERGGGSIVTVANVRGANDIPAYIASKHGIAGLIKNVALDYGKQGIRVNAISPGAMNTPMLRANIEKDPQYEEWINSSMPIGRVGEPSEVAESALWLMSEQSSFVLGQTLNVDGGWTVK